jgi:hypothetical protein
MKRIIKILLLLHLFSPCTAQYTVTKVFGKVQTSNGVLLKTGSKLNETDILSFSSPNDAVRLIIPGKGIYVIGPSANAKKNSNAIVEALKTTLQIKPKPGNLSGRSETYESVPTAFETEPLINPHNLISLENKYLFARSTYDIPNGSKFFLQIEYPGSNPEIRSLKTSLDTLLLYSTDFQPSHTEVDHNVKYRLGFYSKEKEASEFIIQIIPYLDNSGEMDAIIEVIVGESKITDKAELRKECYAEVYQALGKPSYILFSTVFERLASTIVKK